MEYVKFGKTGLGVSRLCIGCMTYGIPNRGPHPWTLDEEKSRPLIRKALDLGINFFDTANVYSDGTSEEIVGRALKDFVKRDDVVLATKVNARMRPGPNGAGLSRKAIFAEIDNSLKRLVTDFVDLYQIHRWDPTVPIEEKGALYRRLEHARLAVCQGDLYISNTRPDRVRQHAGPPQSDQSRGGAGDAAVLSRPGHCRAALEPAGARVADTGLEREQ
jgi:aryl-alcohol dehydrogenase-like predicted oxidoreductase